MQYTVTKRLHCAMIAQQVTGRLSIVDGSAPLTCIDDQRKEGLPMKLVFHTALMTALLGVSVVCFAQHGPGLDTPIAMLAQVKAQLNLNTSQQQRWDALAAQAKAGHETAHANAAQVRAAMDAELAKSEPDLAAVAATATYAIRRSGNVESRLSAAAAAPTIATAIAARTKSSTPKRRAKSEVSTARTRRGKDR